MTNRYTYIGKSFDVKVDANTGKAYVSVVGSDYVEGPSLDHVRTACEVSYTFVFDLDSQETLADLLRQAGKAPE